MRTLLGLALASVALVGCGPDPRSIDRPNIVLIIADDLGYADLGFMGNAHVRTPHMDRLANAGTVFTTGYNSSSICRPSLMTLLTGLQPYQVELRAEQLERAGRGRSDQNAILDYQTLPRLLAEQGYESFQAGKHWEGTALQAGFSAGTKMPPIEGRALERQSGGAAGHAIGRETMQPVWSFLEQTGDKPYLLWFAPMLPHLPFDAPPEFVARYDDQPDLSRSTRAYFANVSRLDDRVGELVDRLRTLGHLERTLIVLLSDNGWDSPLTVDYTGAPVGGPRGKKSMHDLGFRTPIVFHWPGQVPAGERIETLVSTLDLFPTLLRYAGVDPPAGGEGIDLRASIDRREPPPVRRLFGSLVEAVRSKLDVEQLRRRMRGEKVSSARRPAFFSRDSSWHFIEYPATGDRPEVLELFDLKTRPDELTNSIDEHPEVARMLQAEISAWQQRMAETLPDPRVSNALWREVPKRSGAAAR